jgi:hypothetical protein
VGHGVDSQGKSGNHDNALPAQIPGNVESLG